jgi:hypothetical protein
MDTEAIELVKKQIAYELRAGEITSKVIWHLACLGRMRHHQGDYVKAHYVFRRALDLCTQAKELCHKTLSFLLDAYGRLLREMAHALCQSA